MTTTNVQLQELARLLKINNLIILLQENLIDAEPINLKNGRYVFNLSQNVALDGGTHWTGLFCRDSVCMYYDSFGSTMPVKVLSWIKKGNPKARPKAIYISIHISQALESNLCGWYVLGFLTHNSRSENRNLNESTNSFVNQFSDNPDFNAGKIRQIFNMYIDKKHFPINLWRILFSKIKYT